LGPWRAGRDRGQGIAGDRDQPPVDRVDSEPRLLQGYRAQEEFFAILAEGAISEEAGSSERDSGLGHGALFPFAIGQDELAFLGSLEAE